MTEEVWRPIPDWEDRYHVSNHGRVKRVLPAPGCRQNRILVPVKHKNGYVVVQFYRGARGTGKIFSIHRLVARTFLGEAPGKQVNHKNGVRDDNRLENLEWMTASENCLHGFRVNKRKHPRPAAKLKPIQVAAIRQLADGTKLVKREIGEIFGVNASTVRDIINGRGWIHIPAIHLLDDEGANVEQVARVGSPTLS